MDLNFTFFRDLVFHPKAPYRSPSKERLLRMRKLLKDVGCGTINPEQDLPLPAKLRAACLNIKSLVKLLPEKWLNDHIINFYCLYLAKETFAYKSETFTIYTTYFYKSLENFCADKIGFARVVRPRRADQSMFKKNFVIIPVNWENVHWITVVICHPCVIRRNIRMIRHRGPLGPRTSYLYALRDSRVIHDRRTPCILIFDSLINDRDIIFDHMKRYLTEEYKRLHNVEVDFSNFPGYYVNCPQQNNGFDCGIYTLHNIEMLLGRTDLFPGYPPDLRYWYDDDMNYKREDFLRLFTSIIRMSMK